MISHWLDLVRIALDCSVLVWIGWNGDQNWSGVISLCSGYDGSLKGPCWRDPSDIGDGSRGLYPSAPVIILPVNAIAGGLELGDVVGPAVVDPFIDVGLEEPEMGLCPLGLNEVTETGRITPEGVL